MRAREYHGMTGTIEYLTWKRMLQRCQTDPLYAGRGIRVCKRWNKFSNFFADMGLRPGNGFSIDRIDNYQGYSPKNCRWANQSQQVKNRRGPSIKFGSGKKHRYKNNSLSIAKWAKKLGVSRTTLLFRIKNRYAKKDIFTSLKRQKRVQNYWCGEKIKFNGQSLTFLQWSRKLDIPVATIKYRNKKGLPPHIVFQKAVHG